MNSSGDPDYAYMISAEMHKVIADPLWKFLDNMTWPEFMRRLMVAAKVGGRVCGVCLAARAAAPPPAARD